jgi:hypothetical protein
MDAVNNKCNGIYIDGNLCGIEYDPLICAQDDNNGVYLYKTVSATTDTAIIAYKWPDLPDVLARYRIIHKDGR